MIDQEAYDQGYLNGFMDAYDYVNTELGLDISDSDMLERHGIQTVRELKENA